MALANNGEEVLNAQSCIEMQRANYKKKHVFSSQMNDVAIGAFESKQFFSLSVPSPKLATMQTRFNFLVIRRKQVSLLTQKGFQQLGAKTSLLVWMLSSTS